MKKMRNIILFGVLLVIIGVSIYIALSFYYRSKIQNMGPQDTKTVVNFEYIGSERYNTDIFQERYHVNDVSKITWWEIIDCSEQYDKATELYGLSIPDIDYSENYIFITFGRKLHALTQVTSKTMPGFAITVFEEEHFGNMVFYYKIPRLSIADSIIASRCYVLKEDNAVFVGDYVWDFFTFDG